MSDRILRIGVGEDTEGHLKAVLEFLNNPRIKQKHSELSDIDVLATGYLFNDDNFDQQKSKIIDDVKKRNIDLLICDYELGPGDRTAINVSNDIKRSSNLAMRREDFPIICMSTYSENKDLDYEKKMSGSQEIKLNGTEQHLSPEEIMAKFGPTVFQLSERIFDYVWDKGSDTKQLLNGIRKVALKPLNIGIMGMGKIGRALMTELVTKNYINHIKIYTESFPLDLVAIDIYDPQIYRGGRSLDEKISKVSCFGELMEDTDILVLCTSAKRSDEMVALCKELDRSDAYKFENDKFGRLFTEVRENCYNKPVLNISNPVSHLLEKGRRTGLNPSKLGAMFQPDYYRTFKEFNHYPALVQYYHDSGDFNVNKSIIGFHGDVKLLLPKSDNHQMMKTLEEMAKKIEGAANLIGWKSQEAQKKSYDAGNSPVTTNALSFEYLARYQQLPFNFHTFVRIKQKSQEYSGYVAVPVKIDWKDDIHFYLDRDAIFDLNCRSDLSSNLIPYLKREMDVINKYG